MSPMFSIRLPDDLLRRMRERKDINWAEVIREAIRRTLNEKLLPVTIEDIVRSLRNSGEWEMLLCLYLKVELLDSYYIVKNLEIMFPGKASEILDRLDSLLRRHGIEPNLNEGFEGKPIRELFREGLLMYGVYDKFEQDIKRRLDKEDLSIKKATWLLSQFFIEDPIKEYQMNRWIEPHGYVRTLEIMLNMDDVTNIINRLIRMGLVFWDYYSSRAYSHRMMVGADYAQPIFVELSTDRTYLNCSTDLIEDKDFLEFLKWLSREGFDFRAVVEYEEEIAEKEFKGSKPFDEVLKNLIRRGIVLIDYWPHRRRVGRRASAPPYWVYKLTPIAKREILPQLIIKALSKAL